MRNKDLLQLPALPAKTGYSLLYLPVRLSRNGA